MTSVFADHDRASYPHRFAGTLHVGIVAGGIPSDAKTAEGWIRSKISDTDDRIRQLVAETMLARNITADEAAARALWTKAENQGIGAMRSQGYGRFQVTRWERAS